MIEDFFTDIADTLANSLIFGRTASGNTVIDIPPEEVIDLSDEPEEVKMIE